MPTDEIEIGRKYYCREESTGDRNTGFFCIDEKHIKTDLFSFDEYLNVNTDDLLVLRTEENKIISLHNNISGPSGIHFGSREPKMTVEHQRIFSNICVIGKDPWLANDLIKQVNFTVDNTKDILTNSTKMKEITGPNLVDLSTTEVFSFSAEGMHIHLWYQISYSFGYEQALKVTPYVRIDFENEITLFNYLDRVTDIISFFAVALNVHLKPSKISISRLSYAEWLEDIKKENHLGDHSIKYIWSKPNINSDDLWLGGSFSHINDDKELNAFKDCITTWVGRNKEWQNATSLMMGSFALRHKISNARLQMACKWYEQIPTAKSENSIDPEHINMISMHAVNKANELGYNDIKNRISGALSLIKTETHEQRFERLTKSIQRTFGDDIIDDQFTTYLKKAIQFRGMSAHGPFEPTGDEEFKIFMKSMHAMECLCYLLTIKDLPICPEGIIRIKSNPHVQAYRYS